MRAATLLNRAASALILLAVAPVLSGCPSVSFHRAPPSTKLARPIDIATPGPLAHDGASITFPQRVGGFVRRASQRYDVEGNDIGVGYTRVWSDAVVEVTVYVYPCPVPPAAVAADEASHHLDEVLAEIELDHESVELLGRTSGRTTFRGATYPWAAAEVAHAGGASWFGRPAAGMATVIPIGPWWLKTRMTAPRDHRDEALAALEALLAELGLPPTGLPPRAE